MGWLAPGSDLPELLVLQATKQLASKFAYVRRDLYRPGEHLGAWQQPPKTWDCRQSMKFLYIAELLAQDGLPELAIVSAISATERASAEIMLPRYEREPCISKI